MRKRRGPSLLPHHGSSAPSAVNQGENGSRRVRRVRRRRKKSLLPWWKFIVVVFSVTLVWFVGSRLRSKSSRNDPQHYKCPDGALGYLNDDYCDCADGSDEPLTSACSGITIQKALFKCRNGDGEVYSSRVMDGVKDCADGSDEFGIQ